MKILEAVVVVVFVVSGNTLVGAMVLEARRTGAPALVCLALLGMLVALDAALIATLVESWNSQRRRK